MSPKVPAPFPEVFLSDLSTTKRVTRALDRGEIRKIGPRLYTTLVDRNAADVVRQHWSRIAGLYFPQAVIGFRTVLDGGPAKADGAIFLTAAGADDIDLPGHRLRVVAGAGPTEVNGPLNRSCNLATSLPFFTPRIGLTHRGFTSNTSMIATPGRAGWLGNNSNGSTVTV